MATGSPKIYTGIEITTAGGAAGSGTTYGLTDQDNQEITIEEVTSTVEDGQTIMDAVDGSVNLLLYDLDVLSDVLVQNDSTIPAKGQIILQGVDGTSDVSLDDVYIRGYKEYGEGNRIGARIQASRRDIQTPITS